MVNVFVKILRRIANLINRNLDKFEKKNYLINIPVESIQSLRVKPWFKDEGDRTHRLNYDLNESSIVFDLGGYEGEWACQIFCLYGSNIYIFEPYELYFNRINKKFLYNKKVKVFQYGLSKIDTQALLNIADNSSSIFFNGDNTVKINLIDACKFIATNGIQCIDLLKINIEGGEYDLLEHLIDTGEVIKMKNIQVQFHDFVSNAEERMKGIQKNLSKTHEITYQYLFVWENWKLKEF